ncbi:hypothetical protein DOY81_011070 [Sarcophaga bullata]|nr:hypothetical protein DOY81_011070 [Sarcophaga bullata]
MWSTISPTNSKKLLIGSTRSVDYVGDNSTTKSTKISIAMEIHIQNKCISA